MSERADLLGQFLAKTEWRNATRAMVAGDASNRRYDRLAKPDGATAILMDAPPDKGEDVRPFCTLARYLRGIGLSAPEIYDVDQVNGFLILEDLGDAIFARIISDDPTREIPLYESATDVLVHIHTHQAPELDAFDNALMVDMTDIAFSWYAMAGTADWQSPFAEFKSHFSALLPLHVAPPTVFMHRDYHAENLLWLPQRNGVARVGVLDFQDAKRAHPAYDLVSLLQDARRDVPPEIETAMIARYCASTGADAVDFDAAYHVLGAQRNLRILGVFARLCLHFGKPHYVDLILRVYRLLLRDLDHPALAPVSKLLRQVLPEPTPSFLRSMKNRCATIQTL
ncbi:Phosphotransferase enzyme family protein [Shimia sp. SK013]|uniref:aminoglycoside phosphotransferase family protein n=1 Tax=Shimia sp. SK013 TaxID=1389006 RepID=UPI0006B5804F|nr:phosphotransferase [Shimia sp. SK013]KPA19859.1 Phosphotransferase enzyme family protein [Shimia sp. SK013]